MGLAEVKRKQRLVGSAQTKNVAWTNDSSLPGQRLLASMGWSAGQGIGQSKSGMIAPVAIAFKMDNKGIGAQRLEREARASGQADAWIGGGGELGSLFDRLNAAAAVSNDNSASTSKNTLADVKETKKAEKERRKAEKKAHKKDKTEDVDTKLNAIEQKHTNAPIMINPRMAARAKYLRAKRMVGNDLSSINEILGIASPSGSNSPAVIASPALSPKPIETVSEGDETESERKKEKKRKREGSEFEQTSKSEKEDRKRRKEEKRLAKANKKEEKRKTKAEAKQDKSSSQQPNLTSIVVQDASDPSFSASGGGNKVSSLSVQQYLSNKLMLRKAEIVRKRRLQEEGVWSRAATVQA